MIWHLEYTPYIWVAIGWTVFAAVLAVYGWHRRSVPGALPFAVFLVCGVLWGLASAIALASTDLAAKIFWAKVESAWQAPTITVGLWFALEYADLRRWLVRRNLILLAVPPLLWLLLILTNDSHHLLWSGYSFDGWVQPVRNAGGWMLDGYVFVVASTMTFVFVWLFWRSLPHRVPVALCLCGQLVVRVTYALKQARAVPAAPVDPLILAFSFAGAMYAIALFRFRLFDLIPVARGTVIDQMREGMLVLDGERRIMDLNPAAEKILGVRSARARGGHPADFLPGFILGEESEITLGAGNAIRHYALHHSTLKDWRGLPAGTLILLEDVTGQKRAQALALEQQRAAAMLQERNRVARELHDSLAQVLGYLKMQAEAARGLLAGSRTAEVDTCLAQLSAAAHEAHTDIREYILGARAGMFAGPAFLPALEDYLRRLDENFGIAAKLTVSPEIAPGAFEPVVEAQLLRMIQEALTNVRKHARARSVQVCLDARDGQAEAIIQDAGAGFDPALPGRPGAPGAGQKFGLRFMRERAAEVGGTVEVHSAPGQGTQVTIRVPLREELS